MKSYLVAAVSGLIFLLSGQVTAADVDAGKKKQKKFAHPVMAWTVTARYQCSPRLLVSPELILPRCWKITNQVHVKIRLWLVWQLLWVQRISRIWHFTIQDKQVYKSRDNVFAYTLYTRAASGTCLVPGTFRFLFIPQSVYPYIPGKF